MKVVRLLRAVELNLVLRKAAGERYFENRLLNLLLEDTPPLRLRNRFLATGIPQSPQYEQQGL